MSDTNWLITNDRCDPHTLGQFNSVCTISNGYLGLKGTLQEDRDGYCPVTIINGVYDVLDMFSVIRPSAQERPWLDPSHFDTAGKSPAVANLPDPLFLRLLVGDREVSLGRGRVSGFYQELDLRCGLYHYTYDYDDGIRTTRVAMWRFAPLAHPHRVYMRYRVTPLADAPVRILAGINADVHSNTTRERQFSVLGMESAPDARCRLHARTNARQHDVHFTLMNWLAPGAKPMAVHGLCAHDIVYTLYEFRARAGQAITIDRCVFLHSSEDVRHGERLRSDPDVETAAAGGFDAALADQRTAWQALWSRADVQIDGDDRAQRYLRFCVYHLLAAAPRFSDRLSVPVKLLSGEYYQGNTFYDTDVFIVPFYSLTFPEHARTCLNFRYEGLDCARRIAAELGYEGAKFAWQAGPYGEECLGPWYWFVRTNIHINAAVAHSLVQYVRVSGDGAFLRQRGIDILVESARFYASRAVYDRADGSYDLRDVAGPDEAHCHGVSNFYTNYTAVRTLRWAAEALAGLGSEDVDEVSRRLKLRANEPQHWRDVANSLKLLFDPHTRLYEQCAGFYQLPPPPSDLLGSRKDWFVPLARYQALNQPEVLMAMALFRDDFPADVRRANWNYYYGKSLNFSSMSFALDAIMAADIGDLDEAYRNFLISAGMDLDETLAGRSDTYAGLHGTALGGAWLAAIFGFAGLHLTENGLRIRPALPRHWNRLQFNVVLRGETIAVAIDNKETYLRVGNQTSAEIPLRLGEDALILRSGEEYHVPYRS